MQNGNFIKMLHTVLNKSWKQHPTKQQLNGYLAPIPQTIKDEKDVLSNDEDVRSNT